MRAPGGALTRLGVLDVETLADAYDVKLRREVEALDAQIADLERLMETQRSNSDGGEARTRASLGEVRRERARAERRLTDYRNRQAGVDPVGWA